MIAKCKKSPSVSGHGDYNLIQEGIHKCIWHMLCNFQTKNPIKFAPQCKVGSSDIDLSNQAMRGFSDSYTTIEGKCRNETSLVQPSRFLARR